MKDSDEWTKYSTTYEDRVFPILKVPQRRKQVMERIKPGLVLDVGCGPLTYLLQDLVKDGNHVIASDFCQAMLRESKKKFNHPNLERIAADTRLLPFEEETFDSATSVNSILPPRREDVYLMARQIYKVLKIDGKFVAFLPSYDSAVNANQNLGANLDLDDAQKKILWETLEGGECFHTPGLIRAMMLFAGFREYDIKKVFLKTKFEIDFLNKTYYMDCSKSYIYEYLLVAHK